MLAADKILRFLYPARCLLCDDLLSYSAKGDICAGCESDYKELLIDDTDILPPIESDLFRVFSPFRYEGRIRDAIHRLKFEGMKGYGAGLARLMQRELNSERFTEELKKSSLFVPVPLHPGRRRERGYNQAASIATELASLYKKTASNALKRVKKTNSMFELTAQQRRDNVKNAFAASAPKDVYMKNIFLIDDIYTTGATASECAKALKQAGANRVCLVSAARAIR